MIKYVLRAENISTKTYRYRGLATTKPYLSSQITLEIR
jgi:hypothetical protein